MKNEHGRRAHGTVMLIQNDAAPETLISQAIVVSDAGERFFFRQTGSIWLGNCRSSICIDVEAIAEGSQYNLPAGSITKIVNYPDVFSQVIQDEPMTGGGDYFTGIVKTVRPKRPPVPVMTKHTQGIHPPPGEFSPRRIRVSDEDVDTVADHFGSEESHLELLERLEKQGLAIPRRRRSYVAPPEPHELPKSKSKYEKDQEDLVDQIRKRMERGE